LRIADRIVLTFFVTVAEVPASSEELAHPSLVVSSQTKKSLAPISSETSRTLW
jgi:hypothetical protein